MERENYRPDELTTEGQNTYSSNTMAEPGRVDNEPGVTSAKGAAPKQASSIDTDEAIRIFENPNSSFDERRAARMIIEALKEKAKTSEETTRTTKWQGGSRNEDSVVTKIQPIEPADFRDPDLRKIAERIKAAMKSGTIYRDVSFIDKLTSVVGVKLSDKNVKDEAEIIIGKLEELKSATDIYVEELRVGSAHTLSLTLTKNDMMRLENQDPMEWLREKLDKIYDLSSEGAELDSQQLRELQSLQQGASKHLNNIGRPHELVKRFDEEFMTKLNIMYARAVIQQRNMEGISGLAMKIGAHGILNSLSFENGMVGVANNRIQELYDDIRVRSEKNHITASEHSKIQQRVIEEYATLMEADEEFVKRVTQGDPESVSYEYRKALIRSAVTRAVRTGYDQFVASQREAVIVARGKALPNETDLEGIIADPSALFQMFNFEQLLIAKFGLLNEEQLVFLDRLKENYAISALEGKKITGDKLDEWVRERVEYDPALKVKEEHGHEINLDKDGMRRAALVQYGTSLMKDLLMLNDFYSSGWRVEAFTNQIDNIFKYKRAESLFAHSNREKYAQLRNIIDNVGDRSPEYDKKRANAQRELSLSIGSIYQNLSKENADEALDKASDFGLFMRLRRIHTMSIKAPDHAPKGYKDELKEAAKKDIWQRISKYRPEDVVKIFREEGTENELSTVNAAFERIGLTKTEKMTYYDSFKEEYGSVIRLVREKGLAKDIPEQIDFSEINSKPEYAEYRKFLVKLLAGSNDPEALRQAEVKVGKIADIYGVMKSFAGDEKTIKLLLKDVRFEGVYFKTYTVDDALLNRMENVDTTAGMVQVSRTLSPEAGADAYKRTLNDAGHAVTAHTEYLKFLKAEGSKEKLEASLAAAEACASYTSTDHRAKVFRYTYGTYMLMGAITDHSKLGTWFNLLNIEKLPNRWSINELQRVFGPQADAFTSEQMLEFLDHHKGDLVGVHGQEMFMEMERLARATAKDRKKFQIYRALLFMLVFLGLETLADTYRTIKAGAEVDELGS